MSLPGIGPKTAAVVLSFALGRDAMPVDTHVHRVTKRLGLIPPTASAERADRILHDLVPDGLRTPMHVGVHPSRPRDLQGADAAMPACPLRDLCPDRAAVPRTRDRPGALSAERVRGIEPPSRAWEAYVLPLNHTRVGPPDEPAEPPV